MGSKPAEIQALQQRLGVKLPERNPDEDLSLSPGFARDTNGSVLTLSLWGVRGIKGWAFLNDFKKVRTLNLSLTGFKGWNHLKGFKQLQRLHLQKQNSHIHSTFECPIHTVLLYFDCSGQSFEVVLRCALGLRHLHPGQ